MLKAKPRWPIFGTQQATSPNGDAKVPTAPAVISADAHKFGLENFGNTCYANSVLQALYFCSPFRDLLIQSPDPSGPSVPTAPAGPSQPPAVAAPPSAMMPPRRKPERKQSTSGSELPTANATSHPPIPSNPEGLFSALRSLFIFISTHPLEKGSVGPKAFIDKLKKLNAMFDTTQHQDAHEFLNYLLNRIVEEVEELWKSQRNSVGPSEEMSSSVTTSMSQTAPSASNTISDTSPHDKTFVHKLFEGVLTSETRCLTCETVSSRDESFLDLSIDIEQNSSVTACLRQFSASEMLCQKNKFFCDSCCDLQEAEKRMKIKKVPNVLALHLKRFKFQEDVQKFIKLAYRVAFPFEMRLFNTVDDTDDADRLYHLYAIVIHIGNGPHHGHYISIIKTMGTWLVFDDETVSTISESEISKYFGDSPSGSAYVLYYQAADIDLASLGLRTASEPEPSVESQPMPSAEAVPLSGSPLHTPVHPPGLSEENDSSDLSDVPFPITPSQSSRLSTVSDRPDKPRQPAVDVSSLPVGDPGPSSAASAATATTPGASTSKSKGLLETLRRSPSAKAIKHSISSTAPDKSPAAGSAPDDTNPPDLPPLPTPIIPTTSQLPNGKHKEKEREEKEREKEKEKLKKEPERKNSGWFIKRKSLREKGEKGIRSEDLPASPIVSTHQDPQTSQNHAGSTNGWFKSGSQQPREKKRRPSAEPGFAVDISAFADMSSSKRVSRSSLEYVNGFMTPPPGSAASSTGSHPATHPSSSSSSNMTPPVASLYEFPPPRKSSLASSPPPHVTSFGTSHETHRHPPDHKKSVPTLSPTREKRHHGPPPSSPPPRPSTAGASTSRSPDLSGSKALPPVPLLSPEHKQANHFRKQSGEHALLPEPDRQFESPRPLSGFRDDMSLQPVRGVPPPSFQGSTSVSTSTDSSTSSNIKRATRKLSMNASLLGLGKRDKDKKDKDRSTSGSGTFGIATR